MAPSDKLPKNVQAWCYNATDDDQRLPHQYSPDRPVPMEHLEALGVRLWKLDADNWESDKTLEAIKKDHGYTYWEVITVAPGILDNFEQKVHQFFQEHLHPYDESRLILDGNGYWDIHDHNGDWIRFRVEKGDAVFLPPGMYHRFTLDTNNYIKALLLFKEVPKRIDILKPEGDDLDVRKKYVDNFLNNPTREGLEWR